MAYAKTEPKADFPKLEHEVLAFWAKNNIFEKSLDKTKDGAPFSFYDGPPFANGLPHWGHLGVSAVKDMVARYRTMKGRFVARELGWDCHGLPAEYSVEKSQGMPAKDIVAKKGMAYFCDMCRTDVQKYTEEWRRFLERIGRWVNFDDAAGYRTMDRNYMESVIWGLAELHKKGLLYKDYRVNPYEWKFGTVLSNSEASADYREVIDDAITVWFELENGRRILAWTTTPWTLPANSALAVHPMLEYAVMKDKDDKEYILARARVAAYEKQLADSKQTGVVSGKDLIGLKYKPLFDYYSDEKLYSVIGSDFVSDSDGTGVVHIAPAFGEEDFWALRAIDPKFPVIVNVDDYGNFTDDVRDFAKMNIFDASPKIIEFLKKAGFLVKKEQYKHSYPFCERSKEKLIYRATDSWYIDVPKIKDALVKNNAKVDWKSAGGRFLDWISNARPWSISRNRFWGTPLPIWEKDGEYKIFASIGEMEKFFDAKIDDLHRPALDALEKDGWKRIPDVLDCWVESGSMPWAALHYPFENRDAFEKSFPADYIIEGQDQTRGWFYSLMVLATALFDQTAFKTVSANGMVVDENRKKFSKSLGNFVNPEMQIEQFGADTIRLFILGSNFMKTEPVPMDKDGRVFAEPVKNILTPLWNAYHFFTLYANAGNIEAKNHPNWFDAPNIMDRYVLTELNELFGAANKSLDDYQPDALVRHTANFLDVLNNWYIRLNRERFWNEDKDAFDTLWTVLACLCRVIAPLAPFISEFIFKKITGEESVHLQKYPDHAKNKESLELLNDMRKVQQIVSVGKQIREKRALRNRLPLASLEIAGWDNSEFDGVIKNELNVKKIIHSPDISKVADGYVYLLTPKIGARLGSVLKEIIPAVKKDKMAAVEKYKLLPDEYEKRLLVKDGLNGAALPDNTAVVILDANPTKELIEEGLANDALRFIQDTRKAVGLDVSDRIVMEYEADGDLSAAMEKHRDRIMSDALITKMTTGAGEHAAEIENHKLSVKITKA